ncbi:MAG TPA: hypothetical protein PLP19_06675 [bacterium]|nr:hypothetical protein [bacterium]HPN43154.1 hypothetical protein [bacterium]
MNYKMGLLILFVLSLNCQKDANQNIETQNINKTTDNIIQVVDSTIQQENTAITSDTIMSATKTDTPKVEKNPRIKPADYSPITSTDELWNEYEQLKKDITFNKDNWNYPELVKSLNKTAEIAQKLQRPEIAAWQFNNIGYYSIQEFKNRTDYTNRMEDIRVMPSGAERDQYIQETRDVLRSEIELLNNAEQSLYDAIELDNQQPDKNRQDIINNNLGFISTVKSFIQND